MLSLETCQQILNTKEKTYTDNEVIAIRNFLYQLAQIEYLNFKATSHDQKCSTIRKSING